MVIAACGASLLIVAPTVSRPTQSPPALRTLAAIWSPLAPICGQAASWSPSAPVAMSRQRKRARLVGLEVRDRFGLGAPGASRPRRAVGAEDVGPGAGDSLTSLVTAHAAVAVPSGSAVTATESRYGRLTIPTVSWSPHSPFAGR